jgi:hypothetical protein
VSVWRCVAVDRQPKEQPKGQDVARVSWLRPHLHHTMPMQHNSRGSAFPVGWTHALKPMSACSLHTQQPRSSPPPGMGRLYACCASSTAMRRYRSVSSCCSEAPSAWRTAPLSLLSSTWRATVLRVGGKGEGVGDSSSSRTGRRSSRRRRGCVNTGRWSRHGTAGVGQQILLQVSCTQGYGAICWQDLWVSTSPALTLRPAPPLPRQPHLYITPSSARRCSTWRSEGLSPVSSHPATSRRAPAGSSTPTSAQ